MSSARRRRRGQRIGQRARRVERHQARARSTAPVLMPNAADRRIGGGAADEQDLVLAVVGRADERRLVERARQRRVVLARPHEGARRRIVDLRLGGDVDAAPAPKPSSAASGVGVSPPTTSTCAVGQQRRRVERARPAHRLVEAAKALVGIEAQIGQRLARLQRRHVPSSAPTATRRGTLSPAAVGRLGLGVESTMSAPSRGICRLGRVARHA